MLLVCFEHDPAELVDAVGQVMVIDARAPIGSFAALARDGRVDIEDATAVTRAITSQLQPSTDVFLDSVNAFADAHSPQELYRLLQTILATDCASGRQSPDD